jgi:hypothetical protein
MSPDNTNTVLERYDVFLCHNSEDKPEIRRIANELIKQGLKPWLDEREILPSGAYISKNSERILIFAKTGLVN